MKIGAASEKERETKEEMRGTRGKKERKTWREEERIRERERERETGGEGKEWGRERGGGWKVKNSIRKRNTSLSELCM